MTSRLCWVKEAREQTKNKMVDRFGSNDSEVDSVQCPAASCRVPLVPLPFVEHGINYKFIGACFGFLFPYYQHMSNPYGWPRVRSDVVNTRHHMLDIKSLWWWRVIQHSSGCQILSLEIEVCYDIPLEEHLFVCVCVFNIQDQVTLFYIIQQWRLWPRWPPAMTGWINNPCCRNPFTSPIGMFNLGDVARS